MFNLFETESISNDINYLIENAGTDVTVNDISRKAIITNSKIGDYEDRYIHSVEPLKMGDTIDQNDNKYLIISESITPRKGKYKALMRYCNHALKMQYDYEIIEIPAIITNKQGGIDTDKYMILPDGQYQIIMQSNEVTNTIARDKRFIFFGMAWIVTFVDKSRVGLTVLTVEEDEINPETDNLELEIADYIEYSYELIIEPTNVSIQEGQDAQISASLYLNDVLVDNATFTYTSSDESIATVDENGLIEALSVGTTTITVSAKGQTQIVNVEVTAIPQDNFTCEIIGEDSVVNNTVKTYTVVWKNNGVKIEDTIASVTLSDNSLVEKPVTFSGNEITFHASRLNKGYVTMTVTSAINNIVGTKEIQIKGLW